MANITTANSEAATANDTVYFVVPGCVKKMYKKHHRRNDHGIHHRHKTFPTYLRRGVLYVKTPVGRP